MSPLNETSCPKARPEVIFQETNEEAVLVLPAQGQVKVLNATGTFIWKRLNGEHTLKEIAEALGQEYAQPPQKVLPDVLEFVTSLIERGLAAV